MAVDKITGPISSIELITKTNEIIDNLVTINVDTVLSTTSTNPVQNKVITVALNEKTTMEAVEAKGYITGITSSDVTTALGYTPYNSTNPNGYQANVIETIKVNNTAQTVTSKTVNIAVPTSTTQLTNDSGFITGITSKMVTDALTFTPYNATNPSGYQANVIETIKVNGTAQTPTSKTVSLTVPTTASDVGAVPNSRTVNGKTLTADITLSASDVGAVPTSRTVNGKALTSNISLSASDVGALPDSTTIPVITDTYSGTSSDGMSGKAVKSAIDTAISSVYKPAGSVAFASLPTPSSSVLGNVYDVTDAFTTTSDFVEGAGKSYPANTNVVVVKVGTSYKFDVLSGFVDLSGYQLAETAVTHTKNTAVGNSTIPVYVNSSGVVTTCAALNTAAYVANNTLVHLAGAETITGNKTFSGTVSLGSSATATTPTVTSNNTTVATTKFVKDQGYQANVIETVKVNGTALTPSTKTVSLTVPTSTTQLTNDSGYITGITSAMVTTALGYTPASTYSTTNPALTASNNICTWTVTHNLGGNVEVHVYNNTTKKEVMAGVALTSSTVATIELFSTSNLAAGAFKAIVIGK